MQFLWIARAVLLLAVILHIWSATSLKLLSNSARPVGYKQVAHEESTLASRTMIWGGILLGVFIVFHILHLTTGTLTPGFTFEHGKVFHNVTGAFQNVGVAIFYIVAMIALFMHLYHGVWSMLQTLGANHPRYNSWRKKLALAIAILVAIGNISFPVAVLTGLVG
jgi:succinate dehydrogenase / fumarate reductase cytochrome b subunit